MELIQLGKQDVVFAGGGMTDHVLNNFSILSRFSNRLLLSVRDEESVGYFVRSGLQLTCHPDERISLIPLPYARLRTNGLVWDLADEELEIGRRDGASNRATGTSIRIVVRSGLVVLFHYPALPSIA